MFGGIDLDHLGKEEDEYLSKNNKKNKKHKKHKNKIDIFYKNI
jgi:hypothetical protein